MSNERLPQVAVGEKYGLRGMTPLRNAAIADTSTEACEGGVIPWASAARVAARLLMKTASSSVAAGFTHTATISTSCAKSADENRSAACWVTPAATPAWAAPQVSVPWRSSVIVALLTNSVGGCTGTLGAHTARNGTWPGVGWASAVANAVPIGPSRPPNTLLIWAACAPSPAKPSPISIAVVTSFRLRAARAGARTATASIHRWSRCLLWCRTRAMPYSGALHRRWGSRGAYFGDR